MNFKTWILSLTFLFMCSIFSYAQEPFEGTVVYQLNYQNMSPEMEMYKSALPTEMTIYFKEGKIKAEQQTAAGSQVLITNQSEKNSVVLMDLMGNKIAMQISEADFNRQLEEMKDQRIDYKDESKTIAGYKCEKAIITNPTTGQKTTVFFTTEFANPGNQYLTLSGFPLYYEDEGLNGLTMELTATEVNEKSISDDTFEIPEGYEMMTPEELQKMYDGLGQ